MAVAKITRVTRAQGILAAYWDFSFVLSNTNGTVFEGTITLREARFFASQHDSGPVAEMCRTIDATPFAEFSWLAGRMFVGKLDGELASLLPEDAPV
jgi:hypothetical protein